MMPLKMPPNLVEHFYLGGSSIASLRGVQLISDRQPEEWLAATVHRADDPNVGASHTEDGTLLSDLVAADPVGWTGVDRGRGADVGILVKLIDAGQRLPVHVHPGREFAVTHLDCPYGKTEAWLVLAADQSAPYVWVGWKADVDPDELERRVEAQDSEWMFAHLNRLEVRPGDAILVPAGTPHALGSGVFVLEVQEPTDFSILLEWSVTTATREESHLGIGFDKVLPAVDNHALGVDALAALRHHVDFESSSPDAVAALPADADPFFHIDLLSPTSDGSPTIDPGFAVLLVLSGSGSISSESAGSIDLSQGEVWAVPAGFGRWSATGDVRIIVSRPGPAI